MPPVRISMGTSGLPPNIVDQIMEAEKIPLKTLEEKKKKDEDVLKLVGDLDTKVQDITKSLGELTSVRGFTDMKLASGDPNIIDGTVDPSVASTGEYTVEVESLATKPGAMSNGFPDRNESEIGVGYIKLDTPNGMKEIYISGQNSTLDGVARQINNANQGVRASVIKDRRDPENPFRLLITGLSTGDDKQVKFPTVYMLDGDEDFFFDESKEAKNAKVKIDGFEVELPENTAKDLIPGVTLDFKQAVPGRPVRINVKENAEAISGKVKSFVDAYNAALGFIQNQHKLTKGTNGKEQMGPLGGDGMIRTVENTLRRVILNPQNGVDSKYRLVSDMGVEFNRNGTLNFNQEKFNKVLQTDASEVAKFMRGDGFSIGFVPTVKRNISDLTAAQFGPLGLRKSSLGDKVKATNQRIEDKTKQLEKKEEGLRRKFADLESKMSELQSQMGQVKAMGGG